MNIHILSQGNELTQGQILNSNAHWLCQYFWNLGYTVYSMDTLPDNEEQIIESLRRNAQEVDIIVSTGGLGPTEDDHTMQAVSKAFDLELEENPQAIEHLQRYHEARNRPMLNRKMAYMPKGSTIIDNSIGSALGCKIRHNQCDIYCFPGVPAEMMPMVEKTFPMVQRDWKLYNFGLFGISESEIEKELHNNLPKDVLEKIEIGLQATKIGMRLKIRVDQEYATDALHTQIATIFSTYLFSTDERNLAQVVGTLLFQKNQTISTAESCTGGKIAAWLTSIAGSSAYFMFGGVTYSNQAKMEICGVPEDMLVTHGAVSAEVAMAMATGMQKRAKTDWAVSVTGIAGPGGGTATKPVGTVHIACAGPHRCVHQQLQNHGTRDQITDSSMAAVLFLLYTELTLDQK